MQNDNHWLAIDMIHAGEEEVALMLMSRDVTQGNGFDLIRWATFEALEPPQAKFGAWFFFIITIFI